jgi:hypothetical protein
MKRRLIVRGKSRAFLKKQQSSDAMLRENRIHEQAKALRSLFAKILHPLGKATIHEGETEAKRFELELI